ncbi:MAG: MerR family DNA-binding transcriptional regulator [Waddliaceae bacterium]
MTKELFSIGEAAKMTGLSISTLRRLEKKELITFKRINRRRYIAKKDLRQANILSLGKAAELTGISYYTLRKWAKEEKISTQKSPIFRISFAEVRKIKRKTDNLPSLL